jgi:hypothetical protein
LFTLAAGHIALGQAPASPGSTTAAPARPTAQDRSAIASASAAERDRELKLLGITAMQPGATAYDIGKPGNANYDESKANPYPKLPPLLVMKDGTAVKTAVQWKKRRAEIQEMFAQDVYGRYPAHIPAVTWKVTGTEKMDVAGVPAVVKHLVGHTDNSAYPEITVDIHADLVTPASAAGKRVPVIIGGGSLRALTFRPSAPRAGQAPLHMLAMPENQPDSTKLLLEKGWGFVSRNLNEIQADNGAGLDKGIIGLVNHGQPRSLDDWGVLRAWAWTDSRILDYLLTDADVDSSKIGVTGHSRGGKEALLALADDTRFAIGYISSSGAGGADLYRRNYGETMGNLCGASEFHWFAGNFMRYAAQGHSADELPVDSHELIALVAPRAVFIGGGALITDPKYAPGDAWQDAQGMFIAAAAASPAWELLGEKGLGTSTFPPMNTLIDTGDVAFRQHEWGHTPAPNWPYFIEFATKEFARK